MTINTDAERLIARVCAAGFRAKQKQGDQWERVFCYQQQTPGARGTAFCIYFISGRRILGCYSYRQWEIPSHVDEADVACAFLAIASHFVSPPSDIIGKFTLTELDDSTFLEILGLPERRVPIPPSKRRGGLP